MRSLQAEVMLEMAAEEAWGIFMSNEKLVQVDPDIISGAEFLKGNGAPGTLRIIRNGSVLSNYVTESLEEITKVEHGRLVTYKLITGELANRYCPYIVTFKFTPVKGKEKEQCIAEYKVEFEPVSPEIPPPEKSREAVVALLKSFDDFKRRHD